MIWPSLCILSHDSADADVYTQEDRCRLEKVERMTNCGEVNAYLFELYLPFSATWKDYGCCTCSRQLLSRGLYSRSGTTQGWSCSVASPCAVTWLRSYLATLARCDDLAGNFLRLVLACSW